MRYSVFSGVLPELAAEEVCRRLAQHGYDGVEWRVDGEYHLRHATVDRDAPRIKALCDAHGLAVAGLTSYVRPDEEDAVRRLIDACRALGCPRFRIFSARYDPAVGYFALRDRTRAQLERLARRLEGTGVKALLEIHFGTIVASPALAFELLRDLDPATIGVILDPANLVIEGSMDLRMSLDMLGDRVDLVHVKNIRWEQTPQRRWRWRFDELADGQCDWAEVIAALRASGYDGWLSLENLWRVPVRHTGYVDEDLADASLPLLDVARRARFPAPPLRLKPQGARPQTAISSGSALSIWDRAISPDARKTSRSAAGQPDRELRWTASLRSRALRPWRAGGGAAKLPPDRAARMTNLYELIHRQVQAAPRRVAIETLDGEALSYDDLDERCARLAARLARLGVGRGDRVAAQIEKSVTNVLLYLACLRLGAVYLPLNTAYTEGELAYFFGDAEPALIVCDPARRAATMALCGAARVATLDAAGAGDLVENLEGEAPHGAIAAVADDDLAALLYTSGTTGRSKGAMLTHRNLASNALTLVDAWGFSDADVLLHVLPLYHVHGLFVAFHTVLLAGARLLFVPRFDAAQALEILPRATVMMGVPTYYTRLLAQDGLCAARCAGVRLFVSGSAPLLEDTFLQFEARTGQRILERYGMTETGMSTSNPLRGERRPGTVGRALAEVELRVADESGRVLGPGEIGVLEVRGPNVFKGYWRMPEKTAEEFREDGFFVTGDLARIDTGGYVTIVGRAKDLIISGGLNVYPKEVESVIDDLPGVIESAVIGLPHPDFGEAVSAVVVPTPGAGLDEAAVIGAVRDRLAGFKVPKRVWFAPSLPRNAMGKVQKNALREQHQDAFAAPP